MAIINFDQFWKYYISTVRKDNSGYRRQFGDAFSMSRQELGIEAYPTTATISKYKTKLFSKMRVHMISYGVPSAAATQILDCFKKWFHQMYE